MLSLCILKSLFIAENPITYLFRLSEYVVSYQSCKSRLAHIKQDRVCFMIKEQIPICRWPLTPRSLHIASSLTWNKGDYQTWTACSCISVTTAAYNMVIKSVGPQVSNHAFGFQVLGFLGPLLLVPVRLVGPRMLQHMLHWTNTLLKKHFSINFIYLLARFLVGREKRAWYLLFAHVHNYPLLNMCSSRVTSNMHPQYW